MSIWPRSTYIGKMFVVAFAVITLSVIFLGSDRVTIPGTTLNVELPPGWHIGPPSPGFPQPDVLWHDATPRYSVQLNQGLTGSTANRQLPAVDSCGSTMGVLLSTQAGKAANRISRPIYFPTSFYGTVIEIPNKTQAGCLNAGGRIIGVMIYLAEGSPKPEVLIPLLNAISDAAFAAEPMVELPDRVHLKILDVDVPVPSGKWSAQENTDGWGHNDGGAPPGPHRTQYHPFHISPAWSLLRFEDQQPEHCRHDGQESSLCGANWSPVAFEQIPPPGTFVSAIVCRDLAPRRMLMARVMEEGTTIREADYGIISSMLGSIDNAVYQKLSRSPAIAGPTMPPAPSSINPQNRVAVQLPEGAFVKQVPPVYPPLARSARIQGTVILRAIIGKDGGVESLAGHQRSPYAGARSS